MITKNAHNTASTLAANVSIYVNINYMDKTLVRMGTKVHTARPSMACQVLGNGPQSLPEDIARHPSQIGLIGSRRTAFRRRSGRAPKSGCDVPPRCCWHECAAKIDSHNPLSTCIVPQLRCQMIEPALRATVNP